MGGLALLLVAVHHAELGHLQDHEHYDDDEDQEDNDVVAQVFGYNQLSEEMKHHEIANSKFNSCPLKMGDVVCNICSPLTYCCHVC